MKGRFAIACCLAAIVALLSAGCGKATGEAQRSAPAIRVAADGKDYNPLLEALNGPLQHYFPSRIETIRNDLPNNVRLVELGKTDLAVVPVNIAYLAYTQGWAGLDRPQTNLRGIAALYSIPLYLIARKGSGIRDWKDIRGKRVAIGTPDSTTRVTVAMALEGLGLSASDIEAQWVHGDTAVQELRAGRVDAVFHRGNDPPSTIPKLLGIPGARAIPVSRPETERIRALHPFLHPIVIPAGAYGQNPKIPTIAVDGLIVCRAGLPEELAYSITRAVFEQLTGPRRLTGDFQGIDLRRIQATPIPLHPGAIRYFRERELFQ